MLWLVSILTFFCTLLTAMLIMRLFFAGKMLVQDRLGHIRQIDMLITEREEEIRLPFLERVIRPAIHALGNVLGKLTPGEIRQNIDQKLTYAGSPGNLNANSFILLQLFSGLLLLIGGFTMVMVSDMHGPRAVLMVVLLTCSGTILPAVVLNTMVKKRKSVIQKVLPDTLDLLLVSVEAGLSFDLALKRVAGQKKGLLSDEITRMLEEIRLGKVREEAMRSLVKRTGVADLSTFISAIIQSERLGTNLSGTLRVQASSIRLKRKQRVEEAAMQAPIKMLFPMIFLIFPALFVVLLGPTAIRLMEVFRNMF